MKNLLQQKLLNLILKPDITAKQLEQIFKLPEINQNLIQLIIVSNYVPTLVLDKVFEFSDLELNWLHAIVLHTNASCKLLENIFQHVKNTDEIYCMQIIHCIAQHPNSSSTLLNQILAKYPELDSNSHLVHYIANNPNSNIDILNKLLISPGVSTNIFLLKIIIQNAVNQNFSDIINKILQLLKGLDPNNSLVTLEKIHILLITTPPAELILEILGEYKIQDLENYSFQKLLNHYEIIAKYQLIDQLWSMIGSKSFKRNQPNLSHLPADIKAYILTFINSKYLLSKVDPNAVIFSNKFKIKNTEPQLIIKANKMERIANIYRIL